MGAMKELAIILDELEYGKFYNVEYKDCSGNIVKKHHIMYYDKAFVSYACDQYLRFLDNGYLYINPYRLIDIEESIEIDPTRVPLKLMNDQKIYKWSEEWVAELQRDNLVIIQHDYMPEGRNNIDKQYALFMKLQGVSGNMEFMITRNGWHEVVSISPADIIEHRAYIRRPNEDMNIDHMIDYVHGYDWNMDVLKIGKAYRLVKGDKKHDALLRKIDECYLTFTIIEENCTNGEILVNPVLDVAKYDVYPMELITNETSAES